MKRPHIGFIALLVFVVLAAASLMLPFFTCSSKCGFRTQGLLQAKQIYLGLRLYAQDHDSRLPEKLEELHPDYISSEVIMNNLYFTTPGVRLDVLPENAILLFRTVTNPNGKDPSMIVIRANGSGALKKIPKAQQ